MVLKVGLAWSPSEYLQEPHICRLRYTACVSDDLTQDSDSQGFTRQVFDVVKGIRSSRC